MKLKYSFETVEMGDEIVAVPVDSSANVLHGVVKLNKEGQEIFEMLKNDISEDEIIRNLTEKYDNDQKDLADIVHSFIATLISNGLLDG